MNCAFCGKEIDDDVKVCPFCRKYIARNVSGVNLEKPAAEPAAMPAAETASYAEEKLCPCCQTPVKPGASFCGKCGASLNGSSGGYQGNNPYSDQGNSGGRDRATGIRATALMKDMNIMLYWIIGCIAVNFVPYIGTLLTYVAYIYILIQTPSLADRCYQLLDGEGDLMARIAKVRPRIKLLWGLFAGYAVTAIPAVVILLNLVSEMQALQEAGGHLDSFPPMFMPALLLLLIATVFWLVSLVFLIIMFINFFKVKSAVENIARGY
ncbi:double zinc ribbon domain-containing protein [Succinimonas sp.]|uniref:zinc ribbon domain-containing protein n=1 Tax=Succinimonas sp. TaxID=1936151 RepID=UPI003863626B